MRQYIVDESTYKSVEYGYLAIYKRSNITSADELELFKAAISTAVGLCKGCKVLKLLLDADKQYRVTAQLGLATDSFDRDGKIVDQCSYEHVTRAMIEDNLKHFTGGILQRPPVFSALKIKGKRASDIARASSSSGTGNAFEMKPRSVMCYDVQCVDFKPPYFTLEVKCGKGFYVRSLVSDLTKALGSCGHVTDLVRTKHGLFTLDDCLQATDYTMSRVIDAVRLTRDKFPIYTKYVNNKA